MAMDNKKNSAKEQFTAKVDQLHKEDLPAINFSNYNSFVVLYEKMLEIEKKLDSLKFDQK
jgi:hypothetical protein